jgi:hypothetical protein
MFQIDNASAATTKPASTPPGTAGYFTDGNPAVGEAATIVPAEWLNAVMMEVCNAITATGVALNKASFTQLTTAIKALAGNTGVTPPQFDNSTNTSTTAFVQRALGSRSGYTVYAVNTVLAAADIGKYVYANASITLTLPNPANVPQGASIYIQAGSGFTATVTTPVGVITGPNGNSTASLQLTSGTAAEFLNTGTGWLAVGGSGLSLLASAGYQKFPGGLILQWGTVSGNTAGQLGWAYPVTFPHNYLGSMGVYVNGGINPQPTAITCAETATPIATTGSVTYIVSGGGVGVNGPQVRLLAWGY